MDNADSLQSALLGCGHRNSTVLCYVILLYVAAR
jgi:hypothetical protein